MGFLGPPRHGPLDGPCDARDHRAAARRATDAFVYRTSFDSGTMAGPTSFALVGVYGPLALKRAVSFTVAVVYVVCQHSVVEPFVITSWAVAGSVSPSTGMGRFTPFPLACTLALPLTPAFSFKLVMPSGVAARFL